MLNIKGTVTNNTTSLSIMNKIIKCGRLNTTVYKDLNSRKHFQLSLLDPRL